MKTLVFRFFRSNVLHIFVKYILLRNQEFYIQLLCDLLQNEEKKIYIYILSSAYLVKLGEEECHLVEIVG